MQVLGYELQNEPLAIVVKYGHAIEEYLQKNLRYRPLQQRRPPLNVFCDMNNKSSVGVTTISRESENRIYVDKSHNA